MSLNNDIWNDPHTFPAVTELVPTIIQHVAEGAAGALKIRGSVFAVLEPDDGTRYEMAIIATPGHPAPYRFANSLGPMYPWMGQPTVHPDYAAEHYVSNHNMWTATVIALFLNTIAEQLETP